MQRYEKTDEFLVRRKAGLEIYQRLYYLYIYRFRRLQNSHTDQERCNSDLCKERTKQFIPKINKYAKLNFCVACRTFWPKNLQQCQCCKTILRKNPRSSRFRIKKYIE